MVKYILFIISFAYIYWISGIGVETYLKRGGLQNVLGGGKFAYQVLTERFRRKNMILIASCILIAAFTPLSFAWWKILICGLALWGIHFFGYWEAFHMSLIRGLIEGIALIPLMYFVNNWSLIPIIFCIIGFGGANLLSKNDPNLGIDWWWVCSAFIGGCIGLAIGYIL